MDTGTIFVLYMVALAGLGLIIGSFLNVVAYRVPLGMSISHPGSACPNCKNSIAAYDNIPVLSWLILRGKCRHCALPIPDRYPLVEFMTMLTWVAIGVWGWQPDQISPTGNLPMINPLVPLVLIMASMGIALWLIDLDHLRLPDVLVLPQYPLAIVGLTFAGIVTGDWPIGRALASMGIWLLLFGGVWFATAGRGMGFGDVKLAPVLGLVLGWVGWGPSVIGLFAGFMFGGLYGIVLMIRTKVQRRTKVPYGPFLLLGAFFGLMFGESIWNWYLQFMGF